jgi:hypothetical protein
VCVLQGAKLTCFLCPRRCLRKGARPTQRLSVLASWLLGFGFGLVSVRLFSHHIANALQFL